MKHYPLHPVVDLFEALDADETEKLAVDIDLHGVLEPAWLWVEPDDGKTWLIDGRNRQNAVARANKLRVLRWERVVAAKLIDEELDLKDPKDAGIKERLYGEHWGRRLPDVPKAFLLAITDDYPIYPIVRQFLAGKPEQLELPVRTFTGTCVVPFALSRNFLRRHLTESQRAWLAVNAAAMIEEESRQRMKTGTLASREARGKTAEKIASLARVSRATVNRAKAVKDHGTPELQEAVSKGRITVNRAAAFAKLPPKEQLQRIQDQAKTASRSVNDHDARDAFERWTGKVEKMHRQYASFEHAVPELTAWAEQGLELHATVLARILEGRDPPKTRKRRRR